MARRRGRTAAGKRSKFEDRLAEELEYQSVDFEYETTKIKWEQRKTRTYTPDFNLPNGIIIEAKGYFRNDDRQKHLAIQEQHPELDIRFVFQNPNLPLYKGSKTTYGMWAEQKGFKWAGVSIPKEWIDE